MSTSRTVQTDLGDFTITATTPRSGSLVSRGVVAVEGRDWQISTRWNIRDAVDGSPDPDVIISTLGLHTNGTWAQGARGNWYTPVVRRLQTTLGPHIRRLVADGVATL